MAGGRESLDRDRLPALRILYRYLDLEDTSDHRQEHRPLVFRRQSRARTYLHGPDVNRGLGFAPSTKVSYDFTPVVGGGLEWYADYGAIGNISPVHNQQQQIFVVADLNVSPLWEINIGVGMGATAATDRLIVKAILGRRFDWGRHSPID